MYRRHASSRWALWVFAAALLLKSAMPWLATAAAQQQGKALVEVCTVYGVALVKAGGDEAGSAPGHAAAHVADHCALNALTALANLEPAPISTALAPQRGVARAPVASPAVAFDACAAWAAALEHGPPTHA